MATRKIDIVQPGPPSPSSVLSSMDQCTKCGICQAHCPVAAVTDTFPGPKYTGPQAQRFRLFDNTDEHSAMLCNGCGVCTSVCPNNVAITDIITLAKADKVQGGKATGVGQRLLNRPEAIGRLSSCLPRVANWVLRNKLFRRTAEKYLGIHRKAPLPTIRGREFRHWLSGTEQPDGPVVTFFTGCAIEYYDPGPGMALVRILNQLGYRVEVPTTRCCSLPMLSSGEIGPARERARKLLDELHPAPGVFRPILSTSTSCSLTLRSKYAAYLDMNDEQSTSVANAVVDVCEFLLREHVEKLNDDLKPLPLKVLYHGPCQLRGHQMGEPAIELLRMIPDVELTLSRADCCGVGGTYGYDKDKYPIAVSVGKTLMNHIEEYRPDVVACDSETCRWNISAQTGVESVHPVELLSRALVSNA